MDKEKTQAELQRLGRFKEAQKLPQFNFRDKVEMVEGFYKGFTGRIFNEGDIMPNPARKPEDIYNDDGVAITYQVLIGIEEEKKELRDIESNKIKKI